MRWVIAEYIKRHYMATGRVPSRIYIQHEFPDATDEQLAEGIVEFESMMERFELCEALHA